MKNNSGLSPEEEAFIKKSLNYNSEVNQPLDVNNDLDASQQAFVKKSLQMPAQQDEPWYKSYSSAIVKGLTKGTVNLGESFGGLMASPEQKAQEEMQRAETLNTAFPTNPGKTEAFLERTAEIAPGLLSPGGSVRSVLTRSALAAGSGQLAKEAGFGETGQGIAELPALLTPKFGKKILPNAKQAPLTEEARRLGLSEKQIAPLIQSDKKQSVLGKFASRGNNTQSILKGSKDAVDNLYNVIGESTAAKNVIPIPSQQKLAANIKLKLKDLPDELRQKIAPDLKDLMDGEITGEKLVNFWQDLNYQIKKGNSKLGILKDSVLDAMQGVSPEFAKDFQSANKLYAQSAKIRKTLSPKEESIISKFLEKTVPYQLIGGIVTGYTPLIIAAMGEIGGKKLVTAMLTNPRLQNMSKQMIKAASENKIQLAKNLRDALKNELEETVPEGAALMDFVEFNHQKE